MLFKPGEDGKVGEGVTRIAAGARRRTVSLFIGLVIVAGLGWLAWSHFFGGKDVARTRPDLAVPVLAATPKVEDVPVYLNGVGTSKDPKYAARWLGLAAQKGQHQAQALLGQMLFNGDQMPPQKARGLMWLTLARDSAGPEEAWIKESYNKAIAKASDNDRAMALQMLEHWVQGRRD